MTEQNECFPNGLEAFFLVVALFGVQYLINCAVYDMRGWLSMDPSDLGGIVMVLASGCVFTFLMRYKGMTYSELFHPAPSSMAATVMVLTPAIALTVPALILTLEALIELVLWLMPLSASEEAMFSRLGTGSISNLVYCCLLAPVLEEMLFRGVILRSFLRQYSKWSAIVGSATLFGFMHMNLYQFIVGLLIGIFLGWLYERARSLLPCIALHSIYNTALTMLSFNSGSEANAGFATVAPVWWGAAFLLAAAGAMMLRQILSPSGLTR
jgi:uncharacterized protein